jgi:hypothetical protein
MEERGDADVEIGEPENGGSSQGNDPEDEELPAPARTHGRRPIIVRFEIPECFIPHETNFGCNSPAESDKDIA